jgi:hypothetical protein
MNYCKNLEEKELGETEEAIEYRRKTSLALASAFDTKDDAKYIEALQEHWFGQIINKDIDLSMYASTLLSAFFEIVTVQGNDIPAYTLWTMPSIDIIQMATHGEAPAEVKYTSGSQYFPTFYYVTTPRVYQRNKSILTGEQGPVAAINTIARNEIGNTIEDDMWSLINTACGVFTQATTWNPDTRIQGIPTTNEFDFSSEGSLTVNLFRRILERVDLVPSRSRPGQSAKIRNIIIPHTEAKDIRTWVSVVSNINAAAAGSSNDNQTIVTEQLHREIENNGTMIDALYGENVGIIRYNRETSVAAADTDSYLHVMLDEPIGRFYIKPDEDRNQIFGDREPFETGFIHARLIGMDSPSPYRPYLMRVKFKT